MSYRSIRWIVFTALLLTVPTMFFLVQTMVFIPAILFAAGVVYLIPKAFAPGHGSGILAFIALYGTQFLVYVALFYIVSALAAKAISTIKAAGARTLSVVGICGTLGLLTQFRIYGGGDFQNFWPKSWVPLADIFVDVNKSYGAGTSAIIYGLSILLMFALVFSRRFLPKRP